MIDKDEIIGQIKKVRTDPVWFATQICNVKLDPWQVEALQAMADPIRKKMYGMPTLVNHECRTKFTIRAMHGPGKTFFAALVIIWFHTAFKGLSPATAPTLKQLKNRMWPNIRKIRGMSNKFLKQFFEVRATEVIWFKDRDHKCVAETGAQPENMHGYHDDFMCIIVDEASGVREDMFPVIESAMSMGIIVFLLLIGNPTKNVGTFADSHLKPKVAKNYFQIHVDLEKTTRVSREWVQEMIDKYGKDSPVVKIRCFGDFAEHDEGQLISMDWMDIARASPFVADGSIPHKRLSIDCADGGDNYTVLTLGEHYQSFAHFQRQQQYAFPAGRAVTMTVDEAIVWWHRHGMSKENGDYFIVDSLGVGAGVCSGLVDAGYPVVRYIGGAASDNPKLYRNRRVQSFLVLRDALRNEHIVFDEDFIPENDWDDLYAQACSIRKKIDTERVEDLLTKKEMKLLGIISPDRLDSLAMQFATQIPMLSAFRLEDVLVGATMESANYDGAIAT